VVELGAGTGGTPRAILSALPLSATILGIEINTQFCGLLRRIPDARLIVHCGSAQDLRQIVAYQVSTRVADLSRPLLGPGRVEVELLSVPPMRLYRWETH
jgi:phosphatidylethanolamine/phosphatidyl-N-methylethanolamine N-methyltransferase